MSSSSQSSLPCMLGVDIGTTSTKAVVFDRTGVVVAQHAVEYPLLCEVPGMAEQDPRSIFDAVVTSIHQAVLVARSLDAEISLVSFSAAMHSLILMDAHDELLSNSITWADYRASEWASRLRATAEGHAIYSRTGTPIHPMSPLCKLLWLKEENNALFKRAARFVGIKEYVFFRLFGGWQTDYSIASATGLFNLRELSWDSDALALAGISAAQLPDLVPTTHIVRGGKNGLMALLGLAEDTPFVIGANDGVLSNLGVNAIQRGQVAVTIGTSGAMRTVVDRALTDAAGRTFCYALTDRHWVVGGPVNNGGNVFRWVRDELATAEAERARHSGLDPYQALTHIAEGIPPGAGGLLFHPYLAGERAPLWNADLRGSFFGLATHHRKEHMIRATLEGVIFNLYSILPIVEELVGATNTMMATGGFARSPLWRQMMADIFEREVVVPESVESSCLGAVVLGLYAIGEIENLDAITDMVGSTNRHLPIAENVEVYRQLKPIFAAIPEKLQQEYALLAKFQKTLG